jgi:large subunit ribosomal protein L24
MAVKVRKGDTVQVIAGKDAGKQGKVLRVDPKKNRLFVEGLNVVKRHQRPRSLKETQRGGKVGGVIEKEGPIHISNVMVIDPRENKPTRVRIERTAEGKRERVAVRSGQKLTESA